MKRLLGSKLVLSLVTLVLLVAALVIPLSGSLILSHAQSSRCGSWRVVPSANVGTLADSLHGVAAISVNDVWAVGSFNNSNETSRTLIEHWNGSKWRVVPSPNPAAHTNQLNAVAVVSPSDIWAVGSSVTGFGAHDRTLIEHWNGSTWRVVPSPNPGGTSVSNVLNGLTVVSANDIWAVGQGGGFSTLILHWNGSTWHVVPTPNLGSLDNFLSGVAAVSASNIWAVGQRNGLLTLIEHWNGTKWSVVPSPTPAHSSSELTGVAVVSASNIWAVGTELTELTETFRTLIEHWNGTKWSIVPSPNPGTHEDLLNGIAAISANNIWAVGTRGGVQTLILHWNGSAWTVVPSPNPGAKNNELSAVSASSANNVWAVGDFIKSRTGMNQTLTEFFC